MRGVGSAPRSLRQGDTQNLLPFYNAPIFAETYFYFSQKIMVGGEILSNLELEY